MDAASQTAASKQSVVEKPTKTYAMNVLVSTVPFFSDSRATWAAVGEAHGTVTKFGGPVDTDAQKQIQEIESLIAQGVNGLVVAPTDSAALAPVINKAADRGIPVVTYLNDVPGSKRIAYVTSQWEEASLRVGAAVLKKGDGPKKAIIVYAEPGNLEQQGRRRGFEQLKADYPGLEIVAVVADKFDAAIATEQIRPLIAKYPDLAYIFGCGSRSAVGAVAALKEAGFKPGQITVTAWDYDEDTLRLIENGWVAVSAAQNTSYMTQLAYSIIEAASNDYLYPKNHPFKEHNVRALPEKLVIPVELVTKVNAAAYYPR